jgi:hypothetical protein
VAILSTQVAFPHQRKIVRLLVRIMQLNWYGSPSDIAIFYADFLQCGGSSRLSMYNMSKQARGVRLV